MYIGDEEESIKIKVADNGFVLKHEKRVPPKRGEDGEDGEKEWVEPEETLMVFSDAASLLAEISKLLPKMGSGETGRDSAMNELYGASDE